MKLSTNHAFVNQFLIGLLVTIGFGGSVGLGTVWMRHQISVLADTNRELEQQYREVERRADDVSAQIESELSPDVLRARNVSMHLGLVELNQGQITPVAADPIPRLVARANRRIFEQEGTGGGIGIQVNLPSSPAANTPVAQPNHAPAPTAHSITAAAAATGHANMVRFATNP